MVINVVSVQLMTPTKARLRND